MTKATVDEIPKWIDEWPARQELLEKELERLKGLKLTHEDSITIGGVTYYGDEQTRHRPDPDGASDH